MSNKDENSNSGGTSTEPLLLWLALNLIPRQINLVKCILTIPQIPVRHKEGQHEGHDGHKLQQWPHHHNLHHVVVC